MPTRSRLRRNLGLRWRALRGLVGIVPLVALSVLVGLGVLIGLVSLVVWP